MKNIVDSRDNTDSDRVLLKKKCRAKRWKRQKIANSICDNVKKCNSTKKIIHSKGKIAA